MITQVETGITPSSNAGAMGTISIKGYRITTSKLNQLLNPSSFFTVGTDVEEKVDQFLQLYADIRSEMRTPFVNFFAYYGYRNNASEEQRYYHRDSDLPIGDALDLVTTYESGFSYDSEIEVSMVPYKYSSGYINVATGDPFHFCHKEIQVNNSSTVLTIGFDSKTKLITHSGTVPSDVKRVKISVDFSWEGTNPFMHKYDNGVIIFRDPTQEGSESNGFGFKFSDSSVTGMSAWKNSDNFGSFTFNLGGVDNLVGPSIILNRQYYRLPKNSKSPSLSVDIIMDSTYYVEPEIYSRI